MLMNVSALKLDYNIYPRHQIDAYNVNEIIEAKKAGVVMPPCIVDEKTKTVVDGFHRIAAIKKVDGEDGMVEVELRDYDDRAAMYIDAMSLNASHGRKLTAYDKSHAIILARDLKIPDHVIASSLSITVDKVAKVELRKTAKVGATKIPIKSTVSHKAGQRFTKKQSEVHEKLGGMKPLFYVRQVIYLIENDFIDSENETLIDALAHLKKILP